MYQLQPSIESTPNVQNGSKLHQNISNYLLTLHAKGEKITRHTAPTSYMLKIGKTSNMTKLRHL